MALVRRTFTAPREQRASHKRLPRLGGRDTAAEVFVDPERALQIATVYRCVSLISETIASFPVGLFQRQGDARVDRSDHPLHDLIAYEPNKVIDAGEFWRTIMGWKLLRGNAYAYIERNTGGLPIGLWPLSPNVTDPLRQTDGQLAYRFSHDQNAEYAPIDPGTIVSAENVLHFRAFGLGMEGLSPIGMARQQVGTSYAAMAYVGGFFARDATPGSVVTVPGELTDTQYERLVAQQREMHEGFDRSHRQALLENGATIDTTSLSPVDAAFLDTYRLTKEDIATCIFGVPPDKVGLLDKATYNNMEQLGLDFVIYCLSAWLGRLERVTKRRLLIGEPDLYLKWNVKGLLRGDISARYSSYVQGRQWGWLSINDIKRMEDENPLEIKGADDYLQPLNMVPIGTNPVAPSGGGQRAARTRRVADPHEQPADTAPGWVDRFRSILVDEFNAQEDQIIDALDSAQRAAGDLIDVDYWTDRLAPLLAAGASELANEIASNVAEQFGGYYDPAWTVNYLLTQALRQARNITLSTRDEVNAAIDNAEGEGLTVHESVLLKFTSMRGSRAPETARGYVQQVGHFARREGAQQAGAVTKTWNVRSAKPRQSHKRMNGETIDIDAKFSNGADFPHDPDAGVDETAGCTCTVTFGVEQ